MSSVDQNTAKLPRQRRFSICLNMSASVCFSPLWWTSRLTSCVQFWSNNGPALFNNRRCHTQHYLSTEAVLYSAVICVQRLRPCKNKLLAASGHLMNGNWPRMMKVYLVLILSFIGIAFSEGKPFLSLYIFQLSRTKLSDTLCGNSLHFKKSP